ncbi:hypothetical protein LJC13_03420 [Peptostreptococcaceae bacterium OttesenSCG-928-C18]|nr:hypothetical protein [Peptostreptococcaceae bacterium OttesenSCG-928-C18]
MIKKIKYIILVLIIFGVTAYGNKENLKTTNYKEEKMDYANLGIDYPMEIRNVELILYDGAEDFIQKTEVIVKVIKNSTLEQLQSKGADPEFVSGRTLSDVTVTKSIKGDFSVGDTIKVEEDYYVNKEAKKVFCMEVYVGMEDSKEYILFIDKRNDDSENYYIKGLLTGQILIEDVQENAKVRSSVVKEIGIINENYPEETKELQKDILNEFLNK